MDDYKKDYTYWIDYIHSHPYKQYYSNLDMHYAPYMNLLVCNNRGYDFISFCTNSGNFMYWHRLDGPAVIDSMGHVQYWVGNRPLHKEKFDTNPLVINYTINKIIVEILDDPND